MAIQSNKDSGLGKVIGIIIVAIIGVVVVLSAVAFVPAGYEGVLLNWGAVSGTVLGPGLHFITPIYQNVVALNTQVQAYSVTTGGVSQDLQTVPTAVTLDFNVNASQVNDLYQRLGVNYVASIVTPIVQENIKAVEANFTAADLIDERPEVQSAIQAKLTEVLPKYDLIVDQFSIVNYNFSVQFEQAIEAKVTQQQVLLQQEINISIASTRANQSIQIARGNMTSQILRAQGNASAIMIKANATAYAARTIQNATAQNPAYLKWLQISEWNGKLPTTVVGGTSALPLINLNASSSGS